MSSLDLLWNGWRSEYLERYADPPTEPGSVFTRILASGLPDEETHIVHRGRWCVALMNAFPYNVGHLLVLPCREVADLAELTADEASELWAIVTVATTVVREVMRAAGVNVGLNLGRAAGGSVQEHLHVHVVPRWVGDANFLTATANTRTLPEALPVTAAKLRAAWPTA